MVGFVGLCYMTNWRVVLQYVPYVRGRFPPIEMALEEGGEGEGGEEGGEGGEEEE